MEKDVCQTCLSVDRRTVPLVQLQHLLQEINIGEDINKIGGVCWECYGIMTKFKNFKLQVRQALKVLKLKVKRKETLSNLTTRSIVYYDFYMHHDFESNVNESINDVLKTETEYKVTEADDTEDKDFGVFIDFLNLAEFNEETKDDGKFTIAEEFVKDAANENFLSEEFTLPKTKKKNGLNTEKEFNKLDEVGDKFTKKVFTVEEMLKNREQKRNQPNFKKIPFKCDWCVLGFTRQENRDIHVKKRHSKKIGRFICDVCQTRFPNKKPLERHCRKHFISYQCKLCKYETVEHWSVLNHCRNKHREDRVDMIHCQQCTQVFRTPEDLNQHMGTDHVLFCNECGEKFKGKNTLRTHKTRIHGVKREFACDLCKKTFKTKSRLESHLSTHSAAQAQRLAYCALCRVQYKSIHVYRGHVRNSAAHAADKYTCPECNKKFSSKVYWTKHYNFYHLKKSQFKCELCNKLFISDWRLKNHRQKHHGLSRSRDHSCDVCGKKFYTLSTLRAHQLTHSSQRSFMCADCGHTFRQRPALYTHARVHQGNRSCAK